MPPATGLALFGHVRFPPDRQAGNRHNRAVRFLEPVADQPTHWHTIDSPLGELRLVGDGRALTHLQMSPGPEPQGGRHDPDAFGDVEAQLHAYFAGELTEFDVPLAPSGTGFQLRVWATLLEIPYGETASYGAIAAAVGRPDAVRAVGATNGRNPIAVIVPCHRVIGADGTLVGYGGGLPRKRLLLELEAEHAAPRLWSG
ncbi:MAG: methylated-DNA--[protein]-cysteine S-methyltransferase [Thermoleophilaceae bacterium]|nr:methylated-DNA--[protein]-cysteine S-methyltransferase [Thermoleophilaceae bacterium]